MDPFAQGDDRISVDDLFPLFNTEESAIVSFVQLVAADGTTVPGRAYVPLPTRLTWAGVAYEWFDIESHVWPIDLNVHRYREVAA